jgi:phage host-nuclease inhibitor protein Gam
MSKEPITLKTSDYITLILKTALDHNAEILKIATMYADSIKDIKPYYQKRLIKNLKDITKSYNDNVQNLVKEAKDNLIKESKK